MAVAVFGKYSESGGGKFSERSKSGGGGIVTTDLPYGGMYIGGANARPTALAMNIATKIEAGDSLAPTSPPRYEAFVANAAMSQWAFTSGPTDGGRLTYTGAIPLWQQVSLSLCGYMPAGAGQAGASVIVGSVKNSLGFNVKSVMQTYWPFADTDNVPTNVNLTYQDLFEPGDYLEAWILNQANASSPLIIYLIMTIQALGPVPPAALNFIIDQNSNEISDQDNNGILGATV